MLQGKAKNVKSNTSVEETISSSALEEPFIKRFADIPGEGIPPIDDDYARAKAYLMKQCTETGDNLWDHLSELLRKILSERPRNIGDTFEEFSLKVREARFRDKTDHLRDVYVPPEDYEQSQKLITLIQGNGDGADAQHRNDEEEEGTSVPDLMEMLFFFEQAGVGLPKDEMFHMALHLKRLINSVSIEKYRFWGKILGLHKNYYVAETELSDDELARRNAEAEEVEERIKNEQKEKEEEEGAKKDNESDEAKQKDLEPTKSLQEQNLESEAGSTPSHWPPVPPLPTPVQAKVKHRTECPREPSGVGVNKKTYFVCNSPADEWIALPDVTPQQIVVARKIKRFFTGDLDSEVNTFPNFPGTEKNYLRAQIARISAGTQISPLGFYTYNEEEEDEQGGKTSFIENPDFEPVSVKDLIDPSMSFWVHHTQYILKQGRTTWWDPSSKGDEGDDEDEEPADDEEPMEKEAWPELLTPLSEDAALDSTPPWSVRLSSSLLPEFAVAVVRSNLWPGAYAFAVNKKFENIYIGFGHKFSTYNHTPTPMGEIQEEYPLGPEIMEMPDPTAEEEEEWNAAHNLKTEDDEEGEEENRDEDEDEEEEEEEEEEE